MGESPATFKTISNSTYTESEVRNPTTKKFDAAIDCAVLYYLTGNTQFAACAADILHNSFQTLLAVPPARGWNAGWIFRDNNKGGLLKEARVVGNQLPIV